MGDNSFGELGLGEKRTVKTFEEIPGIPPNIAKIIGGGPTTIIKLTNGTLMGSGCNSYGELGLGNYINRYTFEEIPINKIANVAHGFCHTIITLTNGTLMACGYNFSFQLGINEVNHINVFEPIKDISKKNIVAEVVCHNNITVFRLTDGTYMHCGYLLGGRLKN